ncbi:MAG: hypothetical protein OXI01_06340 [Albidovulum sp.]|nr:hypothetical protein [Albidovulum sp.]
MKDELIALYGEDQIAELVDLAVRKLVDDLLKGGATKITNRLSFGRTDPNEPSAITDYTLTFAELLSRTDPMANMPDPCAQG